MARGFISSRLIKNEKYMSERGKEERTSQDWLNTGNHFSDESNRWKEGYNVSILATILGGIIFFGDLDMSLDGFFDKIGAIVTTTAAGMAIWTKVMEMKSMRYANQAWNKGHQMFKEE